MPRASGNKAIAASLAERRSNIMIKINITAVIITVVRPSWSTMRANLANKMGNPAAWYSRPEGVLRFST